MYHRIRQDRIDAGLGVANDYVDEEMNYVPPDLDEEGFVAPNINVLDSTPLNPNIPYSPRELAAAERQIRELSPSAARQGVITEDDIRRQADIIRNDLRRGGEPADAPQ
jgi:hypothetical protein